MAKEVAILDRQSSPKPAPAFHSALPAPLRGATAADTFGRPREFLGNRFVYAVVSQRAHGLSIGINFNPDKRCNFDCAYCEVNRDAVVRDNLVGLEVMGRELEDLFTLAFVDKLCVLPYLSSVH